MRSNNSLSFNRKEKTSFGKKLAAILFIAAVILFWALSVPGVRQVVIEPLYSLYSYTFSRAKDFFGPVSQKQQPKFRWKQEKYETITLPDREVLFTEDISDLNMRDPLEEFRVTPIPDEEQRAAQWVYLEEYNERDTQEMLTADPVILTAPVFEHADLFNDGPAALSALLRYNGIETNQYTIADAVRPETRSQALPFDKLLQYAEQTYPDFLTIRRMNGSVELLQSLLNEGIPSVVLLKQTASFPLYPGDDRIFGRYIFVFGYDPVEQVMICQDPGSGDARRIPYTDFAGDWYAFGRQYLIMVKPEQEETVTGILGDNRTEQGNLALALVKYKTDIDNIPDNAYAQYISADLLLRSDQYADAWEVYKKAFELGLPQRYLLTDDSMLQCAFRLGYADDMLTLAEKSLKIDRFSTVLHLDKGWALLLKKDTSGAKESFEKAERIDPNSSDVEYALKYLEGFY